MNTLRLKTTSALLITTALAIGTVASANAERIEHTGTKSNPRVISRSVIPIQDPAGRETGTEVVLSELKFTSSPIKVKEEWVHNQFDYVAGTGPHWGFFVDVHENGDQTIGRFEGTTVTKTNADGSWVTTWQGTHRYTGGTGKFRNIKGSGTYQGKATSTGEYSETTKEVMEY